MYDTSKHRKLGIATQDKAQQHSAEGRGLLLLEV
jgi:hypothetical protein